MVKYCVANKCPMYEFACARAAENGRLECLKHFAKKESALEFLDCHESG